MLLLVPGQLMVSELPNHTEELFKEVEVSPPKQGTHEQDALPAEYGDIRKFYNDRYGPVVMQLHESYSRCMLQTVQRCECPAMSNLPPITQMSECQCVSMCGQIRPFCCAAVMRCCASL